MIATDELWLDVAPAARRLAAWHKGYRIDCTECMSAAGEVFLEACETHDSNRMAFKEWFLMRLGNRLRRMRRRNAIRHRLLPRITLMEPFQPIKSFRLGDLLSILHADERQLVEEVIDYDQALILATANKPGAWPVKSIMVSVRNKLRRKGWRDDRINTAIRRVKQVWGQSA